MNKITATLVGFQGSPKEVSFSSIEEAVAWVDKENASYRNEYKAEDDYYNDPNALEWHLPVDVTISTGVTASIELTEDQVDMLLDSLSKRVYSKEGLEQPKIFQGLKDLSKYIEKEFQKALTAEK